MLIRKYNFDISFIGCIELVLNALQLIRRQHNTSLLKMMSNYINKKRPTIHYLLDVGHKNIMKSL
ncbi:MAG TPA: hypothetical protein PKL52_11255 [Tenuifilaceae bacterium]|nr:hypothetical protein [Tenuifilaceae bacterium]